MERLEPGGGPKYPHDKVIQFLFRRFPERGSRNAIDVLDLGCGGGVHMQFLLQEGFRAHGRDISPVAVATTEARLAAADLSATSLAICSADNINDNDAQFDVVLCIGVLECAGHASLAAAVREMFRVLRPGGACFALFASDLDSRIAGENKLGLHGFTDEEVAQAVSGLPSGSATVWIDRMVTTYFNRGAQQNEHLLTIMKAA